MTLMTSTDILVATALIAFYTLPAACFWAGILKQWWKR